MPPTPQDAEADAPAGHHPDHGAHDHDDHRGHHVDMFRRRFWWSLLLTVPLVATSHMVMDWFGYTLHLPAMDWYGPVLGTVVFLWAGWPFLAGAGAEARARRPGMMLLIAMAISVAYVASMATSLGVFDLDFWWELGALVTIMLLGHWQEMRALGQAQDALSALAALLPDRADRIEPDGTVATVAVGDLRAGDVVLVRSGSRVPADGRIVEGAAELDESMITGESRPVAKAVGDEVVAGTVATDSAVRVEVTAVGDDTALAGIGRLVAEAQGSRSRSQVLADRAAALLFYVAMGAALVTAVAWSLLGQSDQAVVRVVTVLVISCPHALGLAIPLTTSLSSALAARNGILVKDRLALEASRTVDAVLFDKTGTLTRGAHVVVGVVPADGLTEAEVLRRAGGVEADSEHPLARAIVAAARQVGEVAPASGFRSFTGRGVEAEVDGARHAVGGPGLLRDRGLSAPDEVRSEVEGWVARGASVLHLVRGDEVLGAIALEDEIRPEAREAVAELHRAGRRVAMITGDARQVAEAVAEELGVDEVFAEVLPEDKSAKVAELQARGLHVAMVGDGVNDAPALARADVGIAIGAGTDVAIESAGLILASDDPRGVTAILRLSRATYRKSVENLVWAAGYNVLAIPLAAGALQWAGLTLPPAVGAVLMSASTIVVALNAQLLRRLDLRPGTPADSARPGRAGGPGPGGGAPADGSPRPAAAPAGPGGAPRRPGGLRVAGALGALLAIGALLAACGGEEGDTTSGRRVEVAMVDNAFSPDRIEVAAGEEVTFLFRNDGRARHEAVIGVAEVQEEHATAMGDEDATGHGDDHGHGGGHAEADDGGHGGDHGAGGDVPALTLDPGESGELTHRFDEGAEVLIGCHEPGHYEDGMVATVTVR